MRVLLLISLILTMTSCRQEVPENRSSTVKTTARTSAREKENSGKADFADHIWTRERVQQVLKSYNAGYAGDAVFRIEDGRVTVLQLAGTAVTDITPLHDMGIELLDLRGLPVTDISALRGLPLTELYLEETEIIDLSALSGMNLGKLYLSDTKVIDDTRVADIAPIAECPLLSLTLHRTNVEDISPLASNRLQRLHIGETMVTDLSPLEHVPLTRLIFTPARIKNGVDIIRGKGSIRELGTTFENRMDPFRFWSLYDRGSLK
jgi:Leucine-rich repeat (LRR) protein